MSDSDTKPHDVLIAALEDVDTMRHVLVLSVDRQGVTGFQASEMPLSEALLIVDMFKAWLLKKAAGDE